MGLDGKSEFFEGWHCRLGVKYVKRDERCGVGCVASMKHMPPPFSLRPHPQVVLQGRTSSVLV